MDYSKSLKELREHLTLSQTEMAHLIGASFVSYSRWENQHYTPTIKYRKIIKELLEKNNIKAD